MKILENALKQEIFGKKGKIFYLFSISNSNWEQNLNKGGILKDLVDKFRTKGFSLSKNVTINSTKQDEWIIADDVEYIVKKENKELKVYMNFELFNLDKEVKNFVARREETLNRISTWNIRKSVPIILFFIWLILLICDVLSPLIDC